MGMGKRVLLMACLALSAAACGGGGSMNGKVDGHSLAVGDTLFAIGPSLYSNTVQALWIIMSSTGNTCDDIAANKTHKNMSELALTVFMVPPSGGTPSPPSPAAYPAQSVESITTLDAPAASTPVAWAAFSMTDGTCQQVYQGAAGSKVGATGGTVDVKSFNAVSGGVATGTYKLVMGSQGDKISGDFAATYCPALSSLLTTPNASAGGPGSDTCVN